MYFCMYIQKLAGDIRRCVRVCVCVCVWRERESERERERIDNEMKLSKIY